MIVRWDRFNFYLFLCVAVSLAAGCKTSEESKQEKELTRLQLRQETRANPLDPMGHTESVAVYRAHPVTFTVSKEPFLSEAYVKDAKVVDTLGGFALRIEFDKEGSMLLEQYCSANLGRHIAVFSQWDDSPDSKLNTGRWLAAPRIQKHIADGIFIFTPDATREEAENIARGLNNVAKRLETGEPVKW